MSARNRNNVLKEFYHGLEQDWQIEFVRQNAPDPGGGDGRSETPCLMGERERGRYAECLEIC